MTSSRHQRLVALAAILALATACSDSTGPLDAPTGLKAVLSDLQPSSLAGLNGQISPAPVAELSAPEPSSCSFDSGTRSFVCPTVSITGVSVSRRFTLLDAISQDEDMRRTPIVIYTARDLNRKEVARLRRVAKTIVIKDARSPERLLDETALFLHRSPATLPEFQRKMLEEVHAAQSGLAGRVLDPQGKSVSGALVRLERAGAVAVETQSDARGASNEKARKELGWEPRYASWREGFRACLGG